MSRSASKASAAQLPPINTSHSQRSEKAASLTSGGGASLPQTASGGRGDPLPTVVAPDDKVGPAVATTRSMATSSNGVSLRQETGDLSSRQGEGGAATTASAEPVTVDEMVDRALSYCHEFIFPPHIRIVKKAFVRLVVYSKYGPAVRDPKDGQLKLPGSGRLLRAYEEKMLLQEEERNLLNDTYGGKMASKDLTGPPQPIDATTEADIGMKRSPLFYSMLELSRTELEAVLAAIDFTCAHEQAKKGFSSKSSATPLSSAVTQTASRVQTAEGGARSETVLTDANEDAKRSRILLQRQRSVVDDTLSNALLAERRRRIKSLQKSVPKAEEVRHDFDVTNRKQMRFYNRTQPKAYELRSWEDPKDVLRALHRHAFQVTEYDNKNDPTVTMNVRCLRPEYKPKSADQAGWDPYCCVRGSRSGKATSLRIFS